MKHVLELQDNLDLKQAMVTELLVTNGIVTGLQTQLGAYYEAKAIIHGHWYLFGQHHHRQLRHILRS